MVDSSYVHMRCQFCYFHNESIEMVFPFWVTKVGLRLVTGHFYDREL